MPDKSRRIRVTLFTLAAVALLVAAAAFYVAINTNTQRINTAAARAASAAGDAQAAATRLAAVTTDFCTLLGELAIGHAGHADADERAEAAAAATLYLRLGCHPPLKGGS
jgi:hypothetical protein